MELGLNVQRTWLVDLAKKVPESSQLDGFDISASNFPPKEWLPQNINLSLLDASSPLPEELVGKYDIVHVGRIVLFIRNEDPSVFLNNFVKLLSTYIYIPSTSMGSQSNNGRAGWVFVLG